MAEEATYSPNEITLFFGDDDHLFKLPLRQIAELEEKCGGYDHGGALGSIYKRVVMGEYRISDLVETIRLGLIGGGMKPLEAKRLTERHCDLAPKKFLWEHAMAILGACTVGYPPAIEEALKKKPVTMTDGSTSLAHTGTRQ